MEGVQCIGIRMGYTFQVHFLLDSQFELQCLNVCFQEEKQGKNETKSKSHVQVSLGETKEDVKNPVTHIHEGTFYYYYFIIIIIIEWFIKNLAYHSKQPNCIHKIFKHI